jgi:hypothetical protein
MASSYIDFGHKPSKNIFTELRLCVCVCVCMCMCVRAYVCMYAPMYVWVVIIISEKKLPTSSVLQSEVIYNAESWNKILTRLYGITT